MAKRNQSEAKPPDIGDVIARCQHILETSADSGLVLGALRELRESLLAASKLTPGGDRRNTLSQFTTAEMKAELERRGEGIEILVSFADPDDDAVRKS